MSGNEFVRYQKIIKKTSSDSDVHKKQSFERYDQKNSSFVRFQKKKGFVRYPKITNRPAQVAGRGSTAWIGVFFRVEFLLKTDSGEVSQGKWGNLKRKKPPPRGGFFVGWFPNQEPTGRGPSLNNNPQN